MKFGKWTTIREVKDLALRLQSAVDEVVEWTASKNLTIAPDKLYVTVFTSSTHESGSILA